MFPYRVKYTESESDIKNYKFFYKNSKNAKILSKFGEIFEKWKCRKYIQSMFPYTEKYTESESDIQNNNLLYKIHQTCQNTFVFL